METLKGVLKVSSALIALILHVPLMAWCMMLLWNWFVVPAGMKPIGFLTAMGILLLISLLANARKLSQAEGDFSYRDVVQLISLPVFYIAVGYGLSVLK